jgi:hypothetical protein
VTGKSVPHEIALPSAGGIYPSARPTADAVLAGALADKADTSALTSGLAAKAAVSHAHAAGDLPTPVQRLFSGTGSPEAAVTAGIGSLYLRTDGGAGTSLYVKESGAGNTGWIPK